MPVKCSAILPAALLSIAGPTGLKKTASRGATAAAKRTKLRGRASTTASRKQYARGRLTRSAIVRAAAEVLTEFGHARFSVQRVAARAGISPGNLNYHFPTREHLLETLITHLLALYRLKLRTVTQRLAADSGDSLPDVLAWLMTDAATEGTNRLFRELWAIAIHDDRIAKAMDSFYSRSASAYLRYAKPGGGNASDKVRLESVIYFMLTISEGTSVIFGTRPNGNRLLERVRGIAHTLNADR
jgi:AcrR family transcriptional regulator